MSHRLLSRIAWSIAALSIAVVGFARPLGAATSDPGAATSDAAYCAQLAALTLKFTGTASAAAGNRPGPIQVWATEHCKDDPAAAIPILEKTLRDNRVPLPGR